MIDLGLSRAELDIFEETLLQSHVVRHEVVLRDQNERRIQTLQAPQAAITGGGVDIDSTQDVSRSLSLEVVDPHDTLRFDSSSPRLGAVYLDRFISVEYGVWVPTFDDWVDVPVFWGPISRFDQAGNVAAIEAKHKEALYLPPNYATRDYAVAKGERLDDAIKRVGRQKGERRFDIPDLGYRLKNPRVVEARDAEWRVIAGKKRGPADKGRAKGESKAEDREQVGGLIHMGDRERMALFDARGRLSVRPVNRTPDYTVTDDALITAPSYSYSAEEFRNHVVVTGAKPKGEGKRAPHAAVSLPPGNPLSPRGLRRNGEPRYMTEFVTADALQTDADCRARAREVLEDRAETAIEMAFETLPLPHLEEGDRIRVKLDSGHVTFRLKAATIPLVAGESMSFGYTKPVRARRPRRLSGRGRYRAPQRERDRRSRDNRKERRSR